MPWLRRRPVGVSGSGRAVPRSLLTSWRTSDISAASCTDSREQVRFREWLVGGNGDGRALFPFGEHLEQQLGSAPVQLQIPQLVHQKRINPAIAVDQLAQLLVVGGFDQFVDQLAGQRVADPVAGLGGQGAQGDEQVALAGAGSEGDRLQHLRAVLPCQVRVVAETHPLFGLLLAAKSFKRWNGVWLLVIDLPMARRERSAAMPPTCWVSSSRGRGRCWMRRGCGRCIGWWGSWRRVRKWACQGRARK